jgi:Domain of unknown function (DUF4124)
MKTVFLILLLTVGIASNAVANVWKWVDANGDEHYVDTNRPIYTWTDEYGKVHYADKPNHADAISVQLVWVSSGSLEDVDGENDKREDGGFARPGETAEERAEREAAEEYYCKRATEVYESYKDAPQLYRTNDAGEREYLSDREAAATIAKTKTRMDEICD